MRSFSRMGSFMKDRYFSNQVGPFQQKNQNPAGKNRKKKNQYRKTKKNHTKSENDNIITEKFKKYIKKYN